MCAFEMRRLAAVLLCIIATLFVVQARAVDFESLVMPGKLIEGHAKYEKECRKCHRPFSKEGQSKLCLDCHEEVADDVLEKRGFHGLSGLGDAKCSTCHEDHLGRDANVMKFSKETFDHELTDYPLEGRHATVECGACHKQEKKYREASSVCHDCHEGDDIHKGKLGEKCQDCHKPSGWKKQDFDHDETDFKLRGKHEDVACNSCHPAQRYEDTPTRCVDCHVLSDVHAGRYGKKCEDCHRESEWKKIVFDHDKNTEYPLTGKHRDVACDTCHGGNLFDEDIGTDCVSCHRNDDEHRGQYGKKCDSCHRTAGWDKTKFNHDSETDFPLRGKHSDLLCSACHRGELEQEKLGTGCVDCHKDNDVHKGKQGEACANCHNEEGWGQEIRFEHDMSNFPLIGMHAVVPCEECHLSAVFEEASLECNDCHADDDVHERNLGPRCEMCHNPNAWTLWEFDHDKQTDFVLDGKHEGLVCKACHTQPVKKKVEQSTSCNACHRDDDIHEGRFGRFCERCHNTESFDSVQMR